MWSHGKRTRAQLSEQIHKVKDCMRGRMLSPRVGECCGDGDTMFSCLEYIFVIETELGIRQQTGVK